MRFTKWTAAMVKGPVRVRGMLIMSALVLFSAALFCAEAKADAWDHRTFLTFLEPTEIPGQILPAGTYEFRVVSPSMHVAEVMSADGTKTYGLFFTMTIDRPSTGDEDAAVELESATPGLSKRVLGWFSPGETVGDELVYYHHPRVSPVVP